MQVQRKGDVEFYRQRLQAFSDLQKRHDELEKELANKNKNDRKAFKEEIEKQTPPKLEARRVEKEEGEPFTYRFGQEGLALKGMWILKHPEGHEFAVGHEQFEEEFDKAK